MKKRFKVFFTYDGTAYRGWQRQKNVSETLQQVFENRLSRILSQPIPIVASGRTDAGVHARVQVAHFDAWIDPAQSLFRYGPSYDRLVSGLNSILPRDIRVFKIQESGREFHATYDVEKKTYLYFIDTSAVQWPILKNYSWNLRQPLNINAMSLAVMDLVGTHDFVALCAADATTKTTIRTVFDAQLGFVPSSEVFGGSFLSDDSKLLVFRITGKGFLKNMVRSIMGTLVLIGNNRAPASRLRECLITKNRKLAGPTAPAHGLWLWDVLYKNNQM